MSRPVIKLPAAFKGETWDGFTSVLSSDGSSLDSPIAAVSFVVWLAGGTAAALTRTSAGGQVTINGAKSYTVDPITPLSLAGGQYSWAAELTFEDDREKAYEQGTWQVIDNGIPA